MKFYDIIGHTHIYDTPDGHYALRADAEQAAQDAVEMAKLVRIYGMYDRQCKQAQAIIERYEGGL